MTRAEAAAAARAGMSPAALAANPGQAERAVESLLRDTLVIAEGELLRLP
ncbi:hypothetical protein M2253_001910 [Leucobacter luti]|nr:hypothetical protein [Leucobacter luti]